MLTWLKARNAGARKAKELYGAVVAAARQPQFYRAYGVPDTPNGRYEMVVLHLFLLLERLKDESGTAQEMSRLTLEAFCTDMDDCMREMGVGDLAVPKKVQRAAGGFYQRTAAYRPPLLANDKNALAQALASFIASDGGEAVVDAVVTESEMQLAGYVLGEHGRLAAARTADVLSGAVWLRAS